MKQIAMAFWLVLWSSVAYGQVVESIPKSLVLYESGASWIVEEAVGGAPSNLLSTRIHGVPLEGVLWVSTEGKVDVMSVRMPALPGPEAGLAEVLGATESSNVYVVARGKTTRGKLLGVVALAPKGGQSLVLETAEGQVVLPLELVESVELEGKPLSADVLAGRGARRVDLRFVKSVSPIVSMGYYTKGLGWAPEYRVTLPEKAEKGDKGELEVEAWAAVWNETANLKGAKAVLRSGSPAISARNEPAPAVRVQLSGKEMKGGGEAGSMGMSSGGEWLLGEGGGLELGQSGGGAVEPAVSHGPVDLTLDRGQRGLVPLGRMTAKGRTVYLAEAAGAHSGPGDNRFFEAVVFQNPFGFSLLPGRLLATKGVAGVGQGTVALTGSQEEARVKLAPVAFLALEVKENSVEKDGDAVKGADGAEYQKMVVKGSIKVSSKQKGKVPVWVDLPLAGEVKDASEDGKSTQTPAPEGSMNPLSRVRWQVEAEAGNPVVLEYTFTTFVRIGSGYSKSSM